MPDKKLFTIPKSKSNPKIRLFCFPFAGGGINTYLSWVDVFSDEVELVIVQPPGRGSRMFEPPHDSMDSLINELMQHTDFITQRPFLLFGHSLGSRVAYELCCRLKSCGMELPKYFIASGSRAPHIPAQRYSIYDLPKELFIQELKKLNGTPKDVLENNDLMDLLLPLLRADFRIADTYLARQLKMPFPILVLNGKEDTEISANHLTAWRELSELECSIVHLDGDHFFINQSKDMVMMHTSSVVNKVLNSIHD